MFREKEVREFLLLIFYKFIVLYDFKIIYIYYLDLKKINLKSRIEKKVFKLLIKYEWNR